MLFSPALHAQFQMPDPKEMSGIPRPVTDLPDGTVSVRVIRGQLSNNIAGQDVTLEGGGATISAKTDEAGRAEFTGMAPGTTVKAWTEVDGERLETQQFPFPGEGGVRLMLVATDPSAPAGTAAPGPPAATGEIRLGGQSRIVIEPGDETLNVYYLLTIVNSSSSPVNPPEPFSFEMPTGATGTTVMQGSSPQASASGARVLVKGPFAPGATSFEVACSLPVSSGSLAITTTFPAKLDSLAVVVRKVGDLKLTSPLIAEQRDLSSDGEVYIAAQGGEVAANRPIELVVSGLPHHSQTPRRIALVLAIGIMLAGVWVATQKAPEVERTRAEERRRLVARREKLFGELVRLEADVAAGRAAGEKAAARREQLVSALELVYSALDDQPPADDTPGSRLTGHGSTANA